MRTSADAMSRARWWTVAVLAVAIAVRVFALLLASDVPHVGDPANYLRLATAIGAGHGLANPGPAGTWVPVASFPPALPLLLAGVGSLVPLTALTLSIVNALVDLAAALLLGRLAGQLGRRDLAMPLGLAYLVWPSIALMGPLAYKEGLVIALLLASLVALLEQARRGGWRWAVASGVAGGALLLTQPAIAPLLPLVFLALAPAFSSRGRWFGAALIAAATAVLLLLPWWVRNAMVMGEFIPFTSSGGLALWQGAHPGGGMRYQAPPAAWGSEGERIGAQLAQSAAWQIIIADPLGYVQRCLVKFPLSMFVSNWAIDQLVFAKGQPWPELARSHLLRLIPTLAGAGVMIAAIVGLVRQPRSLPARLLWASLAQIMLFGIWFEFSERHRLFMTPFILLMVMVTVAGRQQRSTPQIR